ncbi:Uncharacterised protein [Mycoplasmopsis citelli]|uniref:Transglutaminase-like domain-containing protein n=1 Tax=Mycoplasmopsis citelli TaxID=171281 RepID=A0A449B2U3_9BACT|nr:transglutaminase-like domain-containing protein [Mycoplasmopsis citelli]VEU74918.1 Uncharacterised protein [Mycoplasmopsis citelli]
MKFFNFLTLKNVKFTLLLASIPVTTSFVYSCQSLIPYKKNSVQEKLVTSNQPGPELVSENVPINSRIKDENPKLQIKKIDLNQYKTKLSDSNREELLEIKLSLQKIVLDFKNFPISEDFLSFVNDNIKKIEQAKYDDDYWNIKRTQWIYFFNNYKSWKEEFKYTKDLITSDNDKQIQNEILIRALSFIKEGNIDKITEFFLLKPKEFYIYKLKQQIKLYEQHPYYLQPLERLKKLLYYYQNHYEEYVDFQWGIDKNNKFSLEPSKYYSGNYQLVQINDEYIKNWLKYYQRWNWVFVKPEDQIPKIEDKNIKALQIDPKFKNNKIISDYIKRQINFAPDKYQELWNINPQHPEEVKANDVEQFDNNKDKKYNKIPEKTVFEINQLYSKQKYNNFQPWGTYDYVNPYKININNKKYRLRDYQNIKNFNFEKFLKYQNTDIIPDSDLIWLFSDFNVYNNLLWKHPNLFSDALYSNVKEYLVNPTQRRITENGYIVDYTFSLKKEEARKKRKEIWKNPIPEYKKWFNHWKEVLPKIINKNWDTKTKIKAVAYYIATNSIYLSPRDKDFNYNGYGFANSTQIFTNNPEIQCVGYSMNLAAALTILNIPVRILGGPYFGSDIATIADGSHAWNEVFVDGRWKAIDLTNWDLPENYSSKRKPKAFELDDSGDLFLERNSEWMNNFKLSVSSYQSTIMFFKNPKEYEYKDLPDNI